MINDSDICYYGMLEMEHEPDSAPGRMFAGSIVNAWTFASDADAARELMIQSARPRFNATRIVVELLEPADPNKISDDMTFDELRECFLRDRVLFSTPFGWTKKRWWQFWRRGI